MAIQPTRPVGSTQKMLFTGALVAGEPIATYPKTNGTYSSDAVMIGGVPYRTVRLLLGDAAAPADRTKRFPANVFDDSQLAAKSPHAAFLAGVSIAGFNPTDLVISERTWCKNTIVNVRPVLAAAAAAIGVAVPTPGFLLDGVDSGLGLDTGLPVLLLLLDLGAVPAASIAVQIEIEVRATSIR
jgi:hypothetical protein